MEISLTEENGDNVAPAGDSHLLASDSTRSRESFTSPSHITVYKVPTLERLLAITILAMVCDILQMVCHGCLMMQTKLLSTVVVSIFLFFLTMSALPFTAQWMMLLNRNQIDIVKKGKLVVCGCQGLAILRLVTSVILLLIQNDDDKLTDDTIKYLVSIIISCNAINVLIFGLIFSFVLRGQKTVHQIIGSWLWLAIQHHIQRQQLLIEEGGSAVIKQHLQAAYDADKLHFTSEAA